MTRWGMDHQLVRETVARNLPVPGEVHLWTVALDDGGPHDLGDGSYLSDTERARSSRFRSPIDARRWAVAHGALRAILGAYLATEPREVRFTANADGKPALEGGSLLQFNLSHSEAVALVAVAMNNPVGVDVERVRSGVDEMRIARRMFDDEQQRALTACAPEARTLMFFRQWVRLEAAVKCRGTGMSGYRQKTDDVIIEDVDPNGAGMKDEFVAALAVERRIFEMSGEPLRVSRCVL